jgi:hypothetical protein
MVIAASSASFALDIDAASRITDMSVGPPGDEPRTVIRRMWPSASADGRAARPTAA